MRLQLALNVHDLDAAIDFYSKMFDTPPLKTKPGYANFAIENPPLKLVLFEMNGAHPEAATSPGSGPASGGRTTEFHHLNHLGVEVETSAEVLAAEARLSGSGLETTGVDDTQCCFAEKTETWVKSPDDAPWEWYVKTGDAESIEHVSLGCSDDNMCCPSS